MIAQLRCRFAKVERPFVRRLFPPRHCITINVDSQADEAGLVIQIAGNESDECNKNNTEPSGGSSGSKY